MRKTKIVLVMMLLASTVINAQKNEIFEKANANYNEGEFAAAIAAYNTILDGGQESPALYYNLANAHYKLHQIGASIYYYEKALVLAPGDSDTKNNLKFAQNATIDQIEVLPQGIIQETMDSITNRLGLDSWAWGSVFFVLGFVILFMAYYRSRETVKKRLFFVSSWSCACIALMAVFFAFRQYNFVQNRQFAIIFSPKSFVKSEPNLRSEEAFTLHEGTKVAILEAINDWKKIKLADGKMGWIPSDDLKEL